MKQTLTKQAPPVPLAPERPLSLFNNLLISYVNTIRKVQSLCLLVLAGLSSPAGAQTL
jgi:hypothetical protein